MPLLIALLFWFSGFFACEILRSIVQKRKINENALIGFAIFTAAGVYFLTTA